MTRPKEHDIGEVGQRIFVSLLPADWQQSPKVPDYRVDYYVEIFDAHQPTGLQFAVQVKAQERLRRDLEYVRYRFPTQHLAYFADKLQLPGFLVVVDITADCGYWLFLQGYADRELKDSAWRAQKTITLRIPVKNRVTDVQRFRAAIGAAKKRMAELHPGSIEGAIAAEKQRLSSIDPRFDVKIQATDDGIIFQLNAKEDVTGQLTIKGSVEGVSRKRELLMRGHAVAFEPGELAVKGVPLFEEVSRHGVTLQWSRKFDVTVCLSIVDASGKELSSLANIPGQAIGGLTEMRLTGGLEDAPLRFESGLVGETERKTTMSFPCDVWYGQPVLLLAHFDQLEPFLADIEHVHRVNTEVYLNAG